MVLFLENVSNERGALLLLLLFFDKLQPHRTCLFITGAKKQRKDGFVGNKVENSVVCSARNKF